MRRNRWLLVLGLPALLACSRDLTRRERIVHHDLVESRLTTWVRLMNNAATDSLLGMYWPGPELHVMWPDGGRSAGIDETRRAWQAFYGRTDFMNFAVQRPTVELLGRDVAVTTFRQTTDIVEDGRRRPVRAGYGTLVWTRDPADGLWKIRVSQVGFDQVGFDTPP